MDVASLGGKTKCSNHMHAIGEASLNKLKKKFGSTIVRIIDPVIREHLEQITCAQQISRPISILIQYTGCIKKRQPLNILKLMSFLSTIDFSSLGIQNGSNRTV